MKNTDPRVDAYIEESAGFARPILERIRELAHRADPEIEETIKWGAPHFEHAGIVASMWSFKRHVRLSFWKGGLLTGREGLPKGKEAFAMKVTSLSDLPPDEELISALQEAVQLNLDGVKTTRTTGPKATRKRLVVPKDFRKAMAANPKAQQTYRGFSYSHRKEYLDWITEAKREATRQGRIAQAVEWLAEGRDRNWKYR